MVLNVVTVVTEVVLKKNEDEGDLKLSTVFFNRRVVERKNKF